MILAKDFPRKANIYKICQASRGLAGGYGIILVASQILGLVRFLNIIDLILSDLFQIPWATNPTTTIQLLPAQLSQKLEVQI